MQRCSGFYPTEWKTVVLETSSRFWELIEERRAEPTLSAEELECKLAVRIGWHFALAEPFTAEHSRDLVGSLQLARLSSASELVAI